jgi:hypothetical protein
MNRLLIACGAAAVAIVATDASAINKCIDRNGKVTYTDTACPSDVKADVIRAPSGPASDDKAEPDAKPATDEGNPDREDPHMMTLVSTLANYEACSAASPEWNTANAAIFNNWRSRNAKLLDRLPKSPRYEEILENQRRQVRAQSSFAPDKFVAFCTDQFAPAVAKNYAK